MVAWQHLTVKYSIACGGPGSGNRPADLNRFMQRYVSLLKWVWVGSARQNGQRTHVGTQTFLLFHLVTRNQIRKLKIWMKLWADKSYLYLKRSQPDQITWTGPTKKNAELKDTVTAGSIHVKFCLFSIMLSWTSRTASISKKKTQKNNSKDRKNLKDGVLHLLVLGHHIMSQTKCIRSRHTFNLTCL